MKNKITRRTFLSAAGVAGGAALASMAAPGTASAARGTARPAAASKNVTYWTPLSSNVAATRKSYNEMTCYIELEKITDVHIDFQHVRRHGAQSARPQAEVDGVAVAVSEEPAPSSSRSPAGPPGPRPWWPPESSSTEVTVKSLSIFTSTSVPSALRTWAS